MDDFYVLKGSESRSSSIKKYMCVRNERERKKRGRKILNTKKNNIKHDILRRK
jgi:hypothetical protein